MRVACPALLASLMLVVSATGPAALLAAPAQPPAHSKSAVVQSIDEFCDQLAPITKDKARRRLFGHRFSDQKTKGVWIEYRDQKTLQADADQGLLPQVAEAWSRDDGALAVSMTMRSGSGDWALFVEYCFRPDGTLARTTSTLNSFYTGDDIDEGVSLRRKRWFGAGKKQLKVWSEVRGLETNKLQPRRQFTTQDEPIYKTVSALPFARLLRDTPPASAGPAP